MKTLRRAYCYLRDKYRLLSLKKYSTLAGTLVFFLIMSIVPLTFWLTLFIGKLPISVEQVFRLSVFSSVRKIFEYIRQEAENATAGVSVLLLFTSLYSATTLFYQMRRSGEIIYGFQSKKRGLRLRLGAAVLMFIVMLAVALVMLVFTCGTLLFSRFLSPFWEIIADYALLLTLALFLVFLLNSYICPYRAPLKYFVPGTLLTVGAWSVAVVGFGVYLNISNMSRLYGALSAVIVFMLWLYVLMICFIVGVIINSEKIIKERIKRTEKLKL
ncbi:MAG: YihY/virulence factor BrkB family protein [Clostridia bacterium]|nr:YihY/virulence factor BrkB family protein [Clostridia bacterium]